MVPTLLLVTALFVVTAVARICQGNVGQLAMPRIWYSRCLVLGKLAVVVFVALLRVPALYMVPALNMVPALYIVPALYMVLALYMVTAAAGRCFSPQGNVGQLAVRAMPRIWYSRCRCSWLRINRVPQVA